MYKHTFLFLFVVVMADMAGFKRCSVCKEQLRDSTKLVMHYQKIHGTYITKESSIEIIDETQNIKKYNYKGFQFYSYNGEFRISDPQKLIKRQQALKKAHFKRKKQKNIVKKVYSDDELLHRSGSLADSAEESSILPFQNICIAMEPPIINETVLCTIENSPDWLNKCFEDKSFIY